MHGEDKLNGLPRLREYPLQMDPGDLVLCLEEEHFGLRGIVQETIENAPFPWDVSVKFGSDEEPVWYSRWNLLLIEKDVKPC